jgi:hypothetical protein
MNEKIGKQGVSEAVTFFFMSMEKRDLNQIFPIVLEHLKIMLIVFTGTS